MDEKTKDGEKEDDKEVKEDVVKRTRGRPRKDEKNKGTVSKRIQSYLQRGSYGFEVDMGRTQRVKHSPTRSDRNEKRDNEEEKSEEKKRYEAVKDGEKIETEAEKGKEQKEDDQLGHKITTKEAAPGTRMEGATLPTEAGEGTPAADENGKKKEEDATAGGSTGQIDTVEKKIARLVDIVGNLEARIERYKNENTTLVSDLKALSIMCENDKREKEEMKKELKMLRTQSEEDRHRIDRLEVDLREKG